MTSMQFRNVITSLLHWFWRSKSHWCQLELFWFGLSFRVVYRSGFILSDPIHLLSLWRYNFRKTGLCLYRSETARRKSENQGMESTGKNRLFLLTQLNRRQLLNHLKCLTSLHEKAINNVRRGTTFLHRACTMVCVENHMHKSPSVNKCLVRC